MKTDYKYTVDNNTGIISPNKEKVNFYYLSIILNSKIVISQLDQLIGGGVPFLGSENAKKL